ncbi:MAG: MmgE/PrpD family protein, partial [Casimicrobiaceae bacterium]
MKITPVGPTRTAAATAAAESVELWSFVRDLRFEALPADVVAMAQRCLLDLAGVAVSGTRTPGAALVAAYVADQMRGSAARTARILFDGRRAGLAGAALAGGTIIDAIDAHDGHPLTKGHVGAAVLPALLAFVDGDAGARQRCNGHELLVALAIGYEVATRAGIALHASVPDYHCSGAWNALAAATLGARLMGLDATQFRHALGIAEYFGPRGQILRVCSHPTMLKDGSGWGAHVGVTAALLARDGFTGAPAVTVEGEAAAAYDVGPLWADLGTRWRIREQYFKPYPVCRWAQPAIEGALALQLAHRFTAGDVAAIRIESFREAVALGSQCLQPRTTDEAQYAITYPVAAMLVFGRMGAEELADTALADS